MESLHQQFERTVMQGFFVFGSIKKNNTGILCVQNIFL